MIEADSGAAALAACVAHEPRLVLLGALIDEAAHDMDAYNCACKVRWAIAVLSFIGHRGKSGLHRAGNWLTARRYTRGASRAKATESGTESETAGCTRVRQARVKRCGKSAPRRW